MDKKVERVINLYNRLYDGELLVKSVEAERFGVNERSIQRDIEDLRDYLAADPAEERDLIYDRKRGGYLLVQKAYNRLTNSEILAVCKILLESRAFVKDEMIPIIDKLVQCCVPNENRKKVSELISNEKFHYIPPHHGKKYVSVMWDMASAVYEHHFVQVTYKKLKNKEDVTRLLQPVGIMFSEFYFYLIAYISQSDEAPHTVLYDYPAIYRIDRLERYEVLDGQFHVPYADRFEEGEFRKRVQFMFGGKLQKILFWYRGLSIESILDRFPTAAILKSDDSGWLIQVEVYGDGAQIWLNGQRDLVTIV